MTSDSNASFLERVYYDDGNQRIADSYDQYGNLIADSTAGTSLAWSIAGMPRTITTGSTVGRYSFAADGSKYKLSDGSTELIYMGSMVIRKQNNVTSLDILNFGDGVIRRNGSALEVNYYIKDHLGSIRTVLNASGTILSQHDYYPFGKEITASGSNAGTAASSQRYTFSGKENQATTPAQAPYLDFGARMYSADSVRWLSHDPLAEKYYAITPYSYCAGNPVNLVDPDGREKLNALIHKPDVNRSRKYSSGNLRAFNKDLAIYKSNSGLAHKVESAPDYSNILLFYAHGNSKGGVVNVYDNDNNIHSYHPENLAKVLQKSSTLLKKQSLSGKTSVVVLNCCSMASGNESYSQKLSNELRGTIIIGPTDTAHPDGAIDNTGTWKVYFSGKEIDSFDGNAKSYSQFLSELNENIDEYLNKKLNE